MKSDLLCQEASASSPAAPSGGKRGKQPEEKHISAGSSCPGAVLGDPAVPKAARHPKRCSEHRACCQRAGPRGFAWAAAKDRAALANQTRHQALPPGETLEDFFSLSFASDFVSPLSHAPVHVQPCASCRRGHHSLGRWGCDRSCPAGLVESIHADKWEMICARDSNHYRVG